MVDDDDVALARLADAAAGGDELAHVLGRVLVPDHGAGQRVDDDERDPAVPLADGGQQRQNLVRAAVEQVDGLGHDHERQVLDAVVPLPGPYPALDALRALGGDVDHHALLDVHAAPGQAGRDVAGDVQGDEGLAAAALAVLHRHAGAGEQAVDQAGPAEVQRDVVGPDVGQLGGGRLL